MFCLQTILLNMVNSLDAQLKPFPSYRREEIAAFDGEVCMRQLFVCVCVCVCVCWCARGVCRLREGGTDHHMAAARVQGTASCWTGRRRPTRSPTTRPL